LDAEHKHERKKGWVTRYKTEKKDSGFANDKEEKTQKKKPWSKISRKHQGEGVYSSKKNKQWNEKKRIDSRHSSGRENRVGTKGPGTNRKPDEKVLSARPKKARKKTRNGGSI